MKRTIQRNKQIGKLNVRTEKVRHKALSLRTKELGKGLRNLITAKKDRLGEREPIIHISFLLPSR